VCVCLYKAVTHTVLWMLSLSSRSSITSTLVYPSMLRWCAGNSLSLCEYTYSVVTMQWLLTTWDRSVWLSSGEIEGVNVSVQRRSFQTSVTETGKHSVTDAVTYSQCWQKNWNEDLPLWCSFVYDVWQSRAALWRQKDCNLNWISSCSWQRSTLQWRVDQPGPGLGSCVNDWLKPV